VPAQPVSGSAGDGRDVVDPTASRRDGNVALWRERSKGVQLPMNLGFHIGKRVRDEVLVDAVDLHEQS
jgi:hypothetical protein